MFADKAGAYPSEAAFRHSILGKAMLGLDHKIYKENPPIL
jgi:hypothetical protein